MPFSPAVEMPFLSTLFISVLLTIAMIPVLTMLAGRLRMLDEPDKRKVHAAPIPRCGGIAMAIGAFTPIVYWTSGNPFMVAFLVAASVIVLFGAADDILGLSPRWKLLGQVIAALVVIYWGGVKVVSLGMLLPEGILLPLGVSLPLTVIFIVGVTNAVNLADGLDGLAGGISLLAVCCIGYLAYMAGFAEIALASLALCGAIFGFLRFNTYPATIFMGDSGSQLLGFSGVTLSLALTQQVKAFSPLIPLLLFGLPILDTLTVMTTRIMSRRSPFSPDRSHFHHRLLAIGLFHSEAVLSIYLIQAFLVLLTIFLRFQSEWLLLSSYLVFSLVVFISFYYINHTGSQQKRCSVLDQVKTWLKTVKEQRRVPVVSFPCLKALLYGLIILTSLLSMKMDRNFSLSLVVLGGMILLLVRRFRAELLVRLLRTVFYLIIPFAVYWGDNNTLLFLGRMGDWFISVTFVLMLLTSIVVSVFSTRTKGIWSTPLDFLILLLMLVVPNLPNISPHDLRLGLVGFKCIIFIISFEVLVAENRGKVDSLSLVMALALFAIVMKSFC